MQVRGHDRNGSYCFESGGLKISLKKLNFREVDDIQSKLPIPDPPFKIVATGEGQKKVPKEDSAYDETVSRIAMLRVAAVFYFSLDDDALEFDVEKRQINAIDEQWASKLFDELTEYFTFDEFQTLMKLLMSKLGVSVEETKEKSEHFLRSES